MANTPQAKKRIRRNATRTAGVGRINEPQTNSNWFVDPSDPAMPAGLLRRPAAALIGDKRLLVVGEGVLQYLPFAALPEPGTGTGSSKPVPLMVHHEIVTAPSASVVALLRQETAGRKPAEKTVAIVADVVRMSLAILKGIVGMVGTCRPTLLES